MAHGTLKLGKNGTALQYASEQRRSDATLVLLAVQESGGALAHVDDERLLGDDEIVRTAMATRGDLLRLVSSRLRGDHDIVRRAVTNSLGQGLEFAEPECQDDTAIVRAAISHWPLALQHPSARLRNDKEIALLALRGEVQVFGVLSSELQNDGDVIVAAHQKDFQLFESEYWFEQPRYCQDMKRRLLALRPSIQEYKQQQHETSETTPLPEPNETVNQTMAMDAEEEEEEDDDDEDDKLDQEEILCPSPRSFAEAWWYRTLERKWLLSQIAIGSTNNDDKNEDTTYFPTVVQERIFAFGDAAEWNLARELVRLEPLLTRFCVVEDEEDWMTCLEQYTNNL